MDGWVQPHDSPTDLQAKGIFRQYGWVIFLILSFSIVVYQLLISSSKGCGVPVFLEDKFKNQQQRAAQYFLHPRRLVTDGYKKFGDQIWGIETSQGVKLVLPITLLDELKSHPALSFTESINHDALKHYTGVGGLTDHAVQVFKAKFNPSLAAYTPVLSNIIQREVKLAFQEANEWTETSIYDKMIRIVSIVSSRAFYTAQSSDDEEWLTLSQAYVETVLEYLQALKQWPSLTRPFVRFFLPQRARLVQQWNQARAHLSESIRARSSTCQITEPPSLFHHLTEADNIQVDEMIHTQMALVVAGIHTTAAGLTQLVYDLAVHPESLPELREEIAQVHSSVGGDFTKQSLSSLHKLDSWMKESQRLSSADLTTFQRMAVKPLTLKNGLHIPKTTKMEIATAAIHADESYFEGGAAFDGLRFYKMRQNPEEASKHQYISTGKTDLSWGYGRHACPGRFLADVEIKLIMTEFLMRFEVRNPDGQPRHPNLEFEANVMPDVTKTVMIQSL